MQDLVCSLGEPSLRFTRNRDNFAQQQDALLLGSARRDRVAFRVENGEVWHPAIRLAHRGQDTELSSNASPDRKKQALGVQVTFTITL